MRFFQRILGKGYYRAIYFYEHGLISKLPTKQQFVVGCSHMRLSHVLAGRSKPLLRQLISVQAFRPAGATEPHASGSTTEGAQSSAGRLFATNPRSDERSGSSLAKDRFHGLEGIDELLARMNEIDFFRASLTHALVPMATLAGMGFQIDASHIANHLLCAPHPCEEGVWDLQVLQSEPGGLDLLASRVEEARRAVTLRGKILRTLGTRRVRRGHRFELVCTRDPSGQVRYMDAALVENGEVLTEPDQWERWYDHVHDTIALARRFIYLDRKGATYPHTGPTVPQFLERCALLEPRDYPFFKDRDPLATFPEIGWPRIA